MDEKQLKLSLQHTNKKEVDYVLLNNMKQELDALRYDKYYYGTYEDFIVEKARCLLELAVLQLEVRADKQGSIAYLDEVLDLIDEAESVYPYINSREIKELKCYINKV